MVFCLLISTGAHLQGQTQYTLTLVDENENPIPNYPSDFTSDTRNLKWKYRCGGSWGPETAFQTDANGQWIVTIPSSCSNWDSKITVTLYQTSREQDVTGNTVFQAAKVNVNLKTCDALITSTPGGIVAQGGGYWYTHGNTAGTGTVSFYAFPGSVKLRMSFNHGSEERSSISILSGTNSIDFLTTKVSFSYAGEIKSNTGGWWYFTEPFLDMLPGTYAFYFKYANIWSSPVSVVVSGCEMNKTLLRLLDENGVGVAGGIAAAEIDGSWGAPLSGQTDAEGLLFTDVPTGFSKIRMSLNQGTAEQNASQLTASNYTWQADILRIWLKDHNGSGITDEAGWLEQEGSTWITLGSFNSSGYMEIPLFGSSLYKFRANYNYTSEEKYPVSVTSGTGIQELTFQTGQVSGACISQFLAGEWRSFTSGMEMLPGVYSFQSPVQSSTVTAGTVTPLSCQTLAITTSPSSLTKCPGETATFSVTATGSELSYQWRKNGVSISGANEADYLISAVTAENEGSYDVIVTAASQSLTSSAATLTVNTPLEITESPMDVVILAGNTAVFSAAASGSSPITVQWMVSTDGGSEFSAISGATSPTLTLENVATVMNGNQYQALFSNPCGIAESFKATLSAKVITSDLGPVEVSLGSPTNSNNGCKIDIKVSFYKNIMNLSGLILSGEIYKQQVVGNAQNSLSKIYSIPLPRLTGVTFAANDYLYCKVFIRKNANANAADFPIRFWFDSAPVSNQGNKAYSRIHKVTINGSTENYYYFRGPLSNGSGSLQTYPGSSADYVQKTASSTWEEFGTWQILGSNMKQRVTGHGGEAVPPTPTMTNYPNPCSGTTTITFTLPEAAPVLMAIYNSMGENVRELFHESFDAGRYTATWDGNDRLGNPAPSGVYICRITSNNTTLQRCIVIMQ